MFIDDFCVQSMQTLYLDMDMDGIVEVICITNKNNWPLL